MQGRGVCRPPRLAGGSRQPRDGDKPPRYTTVSIRSSGIDWYCMNVTY